MVKLYIPKKRYLVKNQYDLVDQEGHLVFRHHSNFFRTKRFIVNSDNEVILNSNMFFGLREKHVITRKNEFIAFVSYKSILGKEILISKEGFKVNINKIMEFAILRNQEEVLRISKSDRNGFSYMVIVKEEMMNFLIMVTFTIIVMLDRLSPF